jgi:hypothetical protein
MVGPIQRRLSFWESAITEMFSVYTSRDVNLLDGADFKAPQ